MFSICMLPDDPASAVLDLFSTDLANVQFPDVSQTILEAAMGEVKRALDELSAAEAALEAAHEKLLARQGELAQKTSRALAYAKVYAETDEVLLAKVTAVANLPGLSARGARKPADVRSDGAALAPRKRGRPAKVSADQAALGIAPSDDAAAAELARRMKVGAPLRSFVVTAVVTATR